MWWCSRATCSLASSCESAGQSPDGLEVLSMETTDLDSLLSFEHLGHDLAELVQIVENTTVSVEVLLGGAFGGNEFRAMAVDVGKLPGLRKYGNPLCSINRHESLFHFGQDGGELLCVTVHLCPGSTPIYEQFIRTALFDCIPCKSS